MNHLPFAGDEEPIGPINCKAESNLEHRLLLGMENQEQAWVLTNFDVWESNPFYEGPPVPHPESAEAQFGEEMIQQMGELVFEQEFDKLQTQDETEALREFHDMWDREGNI